MLEIYNNWRCHKLNTYDEIKYMYLMSKTADPRTKERYDEHTTTVEPLFSQKGGSRNLRVVVDNHVHISKVLDEELNEDIYSLMTIGHRSVTPLVTYHPTYVDIYTPDNSCSCNYINTVTGVEFKNIELRRFLPTPFQKSQLRDSELENYLDMIGVRVDALPDSSYTRVHVKKNRSYKFDYSLTPIDLDSSIDSNYKLKTIFTKPPKYKVNRKKMNAIRKEYQHKWQSEIEALFKLLPESWQSNEWEDIVKDNREQMQSGLKNVSSMHEVPYKMSAYNHLILAIESQTMYQYNGVTKPTHAKLLDVLNKSLKANNVGVLELTE